MASTRWFLSTAIVCASFAAVWSSSAAATVSSRADGSQDFVLDVDDTTVTVGRVHACVIKATVNVAVGGRVVCWGDNSVGQTDAPKVRRPQEHALWRCIERPLRAAPTDPNPLG